MNFTTENVIFAFGRPFGPFYALAMKFRAFLYRKGVFTIHHLPIPVISVGNLTMGGSGKTPFVVYLAKFLQQRGFKPAVISLGYRGRSKEPVTIVSDGQRILSDPLSCGDEPYLIAHSTHGVVVATGKKRIHPCKKVIESFNCNIILLDDAFQHLAVSRSIDLVLFDVHTFAGNSRVFPGGELREPVSALNRCDAFILTGVTGSNQERTEKCSELLAHKFTEKPIFKVSRFYPNAVKHTLTGSSISAVVIPLENLPQNLFCICGIAKPERFRQSLNDAGINIGDFKMFPDHCNYTQDIVETLRRQVIETAASGILTTEKDMTKLARLDFGDITIYTLPLTFDSNEALEDFILSKIGVKTS
ncbi:MAG: tetraacyldisaccharide 4'-kinase [Desulfobacterales bacterium]|nr:tetraacyldisaccharide 4'-kinase [Deltaproteobacteria bacterium]NNK95293.1 tetraacyldisaccharide 4'-kinase [Desulfobacterales bacterium]